MCMLSLILRRIFLSFWHHLLVSIAIFENCAFLGTLELTKNFDFLTCMLWPLCARWTYKSGMHPEHMHQELVRALNAHMKFEKVPSKHAEHTHQEQMRSLSIHVRNWYVPLAYASVSNPYAQHKRKNCKFEKVPSKYVEHMHKELIHALCASGTDEHPD